MINEGVLFGTSTLHLYIKGHTQNYCDHAFNSLKALYQKQNAVTFDDWCEILNTRNNIEVIQMFHEKFIDLETFINYLYDRPDPKTANINNVLQVKKSRHTLVIIRSPMARKIINIFKHLKNIEKPKVREENRVTFLKFRRFVVPVDQYYWMQ